MPLLATEEDRPTSKDPEIVYWDNYQNNDKEIIARDQIVIQERTLDESDLDNFYRGLFLYQQHRGSGRSFNPP
jgi:hypothetical protein